MNNKTILVPLTAVLLLFASSCQKEKTAGRDYPQLRTIAVDHITNEGARFNAVITSGSCESVTEYGFVWGSTDQPSIQSSEKVLTEETPAEDRFHFDVTFALEAMKDYFVRSYIKSGDLVIYGDAVKFKSLGCQAPVITDFEPKSATWGDTITIFGKNFSFNELSNKVYFGDILATNFKCTGEYIKVKVPDDLRTPFVNIIIVCFDNQTTSESQFNLMLPGTVENIFPKNAKWGDTLDIYGSFPTDNNTISVRIDGIPSNILFRSEQKLRTALLFNNYKDSVKVQIEIDGHCINTDLYVKMAKPFIELFQPVQFGWDDTITIKGLFHPDRSKNQVLFNNSTATILDNDRDHITCVVPYTDNHSCQLNVKTGSMNLQYSTTLDLNAPIISYITPSVAAVNDTINLYGKYFYPNQTIVLINVFGFNMECNILSITSESIVARIPNFPNHGPAKVTVEVFSKFNEYSNLLSIE